ncbi:SRPBCC family protein [Actinacidiphila sp. bgisy160]|uniref:SRPBCC family protein n=1 Tax=Actinacidiphila sp. bgisy160 TaxID=3413796 RepID=UPI003D704D08
MAVRHRLVRGTREDVWAVLADGTLYGDWVVGPSSSRHSDGDWPAVGSSIEYTVRLGPVKLTGETIVRICRPPEQLELEALSGRLGTARIAFELRPWGQDTLVIVDEHPLRGPGGLAHNAALDALLQLRHRSMLGRLARAVEAHGESDRRDSGPPACAPRAPAPHG